MGVGERRGFWLMKPGGCWKVKSRLSFLSDPDLNCNCMFIFCAVYFLQTSGNSCDLHHICLAKMGSLGFPPTPTPGLKGKSVANQNEQTEAIICWSHCEKTREGTAKDNDARKKAVEKEEVPAWDELTQSRKPRPSVCRTQAGLLMIEPGL